MGNVFSRCVQNVRNTLLTCSRKHNEDEPMLTSTYDSEAHDKYNGPCLDPSVSLIDRCSEGGMSHGASESSLVRCSDHMEKSEYYLKSSTPKSHLGRGSKGYKNLPSEDDPEVGGHRVFVDRGIQTSGGGGGGVDLSPEPQGLSKEFIIKTYSIKNATPSPTVSAKFVPKTKRLLCPDEALEPSCQHPDDPSLSLTHIFGTSQGQLSGLSILEKTSEMSFTSPAACLMHRQKEVLNKLEDLQSSVTQMAQKYKVSTTSTTSSKSSAKKDHSTSPKPLDSTFHDVVISVDPSNVPLSLILLCEQLSKQYTVFKSTYVHSSVTGQVPDNLLQLLTSNGNMSRTDSQIAIILVWKKVTNGPQLIVDPTRQTPILGEANIVRYLARLLHPSYEEADIVSATQTDDFLDLAQLQLIEGNSKERAAAVRSLNSALGKKSWLIGEDISIADYVCWSALQQANLTEGSPANVKKWLGLCNNHPSFCSALRLVS